MSYAAVYEGTIEEIADNVVIEDSTFTIIGIVVLQMIVCAIGIAFLVLLHRYNKRLNIENQEVMQKHLKTLVLQIVNSKNQLVVDKVKRENKDGKLTEEQSGRIYKDTRDKILSLLSDSELTFLKTRYRSIEEGIMEMIEDAVRICKSR